MTAIIPDQAPGGELRMPDGEAEPLLTSGGVATVLQVVPQTIARWADDGTLPCHRTPGGHRRFRRADVLALRSRIYGEGGARR